MKIGEHFFVDDPSCFLRMTNKDLLVPRKIIHDLPDPVLFFLGFILKFKSINRLRHLLNPPFTDSGMGVPCDRSIHHDEEG